MMAGFTRVPPDRSTFSLRLTATTRIYGIRDRRALKLLWYDPHHGTTARAVYPVRRR